VDDFYTALQRHCGAAPLAGFATAFNRFEAYLPPSLALWLLDLIEQDTFLDPSEAVFVILGEHKELAPHADLRRELLKRRIQVAADDSRPGISMEEMKALLREKREAPLPEPARWEKRSRR
jgi:hypothetical protein